jgi:hypothetical protein
MFVSFRLGFRFAIGARLRVMRVVGFDPRSGSTQPNSTQPSPAQPGPALRAAGAHTPLAPLLSSLSHLDFPHSNLSSPSLSLSLPWCPRVWSQESPELDPEVSPSPLLSLPLPPLSPARRHSAGPSPPLPRRGRGSAQPRRGSVPGAASPAHGAQPRPPCARHPGPRCGSRGLGMASRFLVYPLTRSRVRKPTRAVIISGL